jgi:hypothetical protein
MTDLNAMPHNLAEEQDTQEPYQKVESLEDTILAISARERLLSLLEPSETGSVLHLDSPGRVDK